ncbi:unnamed protein product [Haemonchus placei]|uniref:Uncharacterized protein n=1 Tax=Haemonchus placei TaxID=6290 RepID=A0A3P7W735_HAEPC|nr:unnamed protein product [Haemonchus placei]
MATSLTPFDRYTIRSALEVGTFRGQPIITRQHVGFVDNQGVPMAVLGYHSLFHKRISSNSTRLR